MVDTSVSAPFNPRWYRPILEFIEKPWCPAPEDLPQKRSGEDCGNSPLPFRTAPISLGDRIGRARHLREIKNSERIARIPHSKSSVYRYQVILRQLPPVFDNFSILHLSDLHFEKKTRRGIADIYALAEWLNANRCQADLIVLTGDLITFHPNDLSHDALSALASLRQISSRALFVLGNHDYHGFAEARLSDSLERIGFENATNTRVRLSRAGHNINIYGVDDAIFGVPRPPQVENPDETNLLITHSLDAIRRNFPDAFDLILSGHTHWGEFKFADGVWFMNLWGYVDDVNRQRKHWDKLTQRAVSYIHPGLARHYVRVPWLRHPPGFVLHTLSAARWGHNL